MDNDLKQSKDSFAAQIFDAKAYPVHFLDSGAPGRLSIGYQDPDSTEEEQVSFCSLNLQTKVHQPNRHLIMRKNAWHKAY